MSELSPKEGAQKEWSTEWISLRKLCVTCRAGRRRRELF